MSGWLEGDYETKGQVILEGMLNQGFGETVHSYSGFVLASYVTGQVSLCF